jgi:hypothetical protein
VTDTRAYKQFADTTVVPMIVAIAKLMAQFIKAEERAVEAKMAVLPEKIMSTNRWTKEQVKLAFHLYCQIPFGKIDGRNKEIIALAKMIGRTADAVAMKMLNIASLDPAITSTGRKGLDGASKLDEEVWEEFHADWERLAVECQTLKQQLQPNAVEDIALEDDGLKPEDFTGETRRVITEQRIKQSFFRRAVLSGYRGRCCMSGIADSRLLIASHIVPWSKDKANRLNPSNGLCLSALHDKAFDKGLITLTDDFRVLLSSDLKNRDDNFIKSVFLPLDGREIEHPERFSPAIELIARHREEFFVDGRS